MTKGSNADTRPDMETEDPNLPLDEHVLDTIRRRHPAKTLELKAKELTKAAKEATRLADTAEKLAGKRGVASPKVVVVGTGNRRPSWNRKFTDQKRREYLELVAGGIRRAQAARAVGVTPGIVSDARRSDPQFADAEKAAEAEACEAIEDVLYDMALGGHLGAIQEVLRNRAPERWKDPKSIKVEVTGQIGHVNADTSGQIDHIKALEAKLAERLALRAAGDEIEAEIAEAEIVEAEAGQIAPACPEDSDICSDCGRDAYDECECP